MKYLLIDTSLTNIVISLVKDEEILYLYNKKIDKNLSECFLPIIKEAFFKTKLSPKDIDTLFISLGPGSFTGIRVGVTFAKTFAWTLKKKIIPFSSLELLSTTDCNSDYIVPLVDARRGFVYSAIFSKSLKPYKKESYTHLSSLLKDIPKDKKITYLSFDNFSEIETKVPEIDVLKIIKKYKNKKGINPHKINPRYLKLTEAEEKIKND